jgi:CDP-diacylglycerol--glycerol-3-phosphate 3-phosphatidyltransferase
MKHVPNALTLLRLVLAPVIAWLMWQSLVPPPVPGYPGEDFIVVGDLGMIAQALTLAAVLFIVAALTDLFDGMIARAFNAHSKFGRLIDPIADKALVGLPLIVISIGMWSSNYPLWPIVALASAVIVVRDVTMTFIRLRSPDGEGARVSSLAKIKTALELIVIGVLLVVSAIGAHMQVQASLEDPGRVFVLPFAAVFEYLWLALLVVTATLSASTALQYLRPKS